MLKYEKPQMEVVLIGEDIITLSNIGGAEDSGTEPVNANVVPTIN